MAAEPSAKDKAWVIFDRIVGDAAPNGVHSNPWTRLSDGSLRYEADYDTLVLLLGVPLYLDADSRTGVPALAMDVWLSYELRRAGFDPDAVWPRPVHPRILPAPAANLLKALPFRERTQLNARLVKSAAVAGVTSASANILGKNYFKQVDVIMTDWATGPELLISTKRMDSSYGKNAANRVEESYGDAKNLRLRHPLAALGFVLGLRSDILHKEPDTAEWLVDLLSKLGREDDAYHATCIVIIEYDDSVAVPGDSGEDPEDPLVAAGLEPEPEVGVDLAGLPESDIDRALSLLPSVRLREDAMVDELSPNRFLASMVTQVLDVTPVNMHRQARERRRLAMASDTGVRRAGLPSGAKHED
ncbi:hypothetical protein GCM10012320_35220 [Sinomonas cellulolyticus]|uniref:Uncharacterized protein n=1 Tax=Sinomonas cellulolyticus TaxID=2801916 RepID=A0ABS1K0M8_9MICC|nr:MULTISPECIES: hypothetical protein [Sinomonas]MBL0705085.1 hypothetical protein [Sinomonas cellulolyticus]GHG60592.1 hypothetical protein GCM10012320_35220 [Sinomonas sp. KCTC 49339]